MSLQRIIKNLEENIDKVKLSPVELEIGTVESIQDGILKVSGLHGVMSQELVLIGEQKAKGLVLNLEEDFAGIVVFDTFSEIREGDTVVRTKELLSIPVGEQILGRTVNPLGEQVDGLGDIKTEAKYLAEKIAPGVMMREPVNQALQTGVKAIDGMIPVGRGQRELIIGDRQTGKTTIALDTIINQKGKDVVCIYVAIGQKESKVAQVVEKLRDADAMSYTTVVLAGISEGPAFAYLAPYAGVAIAEFFMDKGRDVLIVYDDLSKHAVSYRELSLLLKRPPGREAYPGDVFYIHSRLLERACRRNKESGGGSITALPIIETQAGDISAYIPTNVISITDGQIFLDSNLFYKGIRPAIDVGYSVSRVGGAAQTSPIKKTASKIKLSLAQFRELESFSQFDSDLDPETKKTIEHGKRSVELLKQANGEPLSVALQALSFFSLNEGLFKNVEVKEVRNVEEKMHKYFEATRKTLYDQINAGSWNDEITTELKDFLREYAEVSSIKI